MTSRRIYLHIGTGKTGTTAIQKFCLENRGKLKNRGYLYPDYGLYGVGHHLLGHMWGVGWMPRERVDELVTGNLWAELRDMFLSGNDHMIISTETLSTAFVQKKHSIKEVHDSLAGCPVTIIVYLRRQDMHIESVYNQRVKTGHTHESFSLNQSLLKLYDYYEFLESIREIFGRDNMIVRPYEKDQFIGPHIFADFLNACGLAWTDDYDLAEKDPNIRLNHDTLEFLRIANGYDRSWEQKYLFNKLVLELTSNNENGKRRRNNYLLSPLEHLGIIDRYSATNKKVAKEYLGREDGELFLEPLPDTEAKWQPYDGLGLEYAVGLAVQIWECMQAQQNVVTKDSIIKNETAVTFAQLWYALRNGVLALWTRIFTSMKNDGT